MFRSTIFKVSLSLIVALGVAAPAARTGKTIKQIEIRSSWVGFNSRDKADLVIRSESGRFTLNGKRLDPALVNAFADALAEPAVPEPDSRNLGLTAAWLRDHARSAALKRAAKETDVVPLGGYWSQATPKQKNFFIKSLGDPAIAQGALRSVFADGDGDLYSEAMVRADITFDDGSKSSVESRSRFEFMLPWKLSPNGPVSYNAKISRALAALMPEGTANQALLAEKDFDSDFEVKLAEAVMQEVINDWNILATEDKAGATLARIRKAGYKIERGELGYSVGRETLMLTGGEEVLDALIRKAAFPPNLFCELALFYKRGKVEGLDGFFRSASRLETSVTSVPWLNTFIQQHADVPFRIFYTDLVSLSNAAMGLFAADMHAAGKDQLAREVKRQQSAAILLVVGPKFYNKSYWILLPDKRMILWKYAPFARRSALLKWMPDSFPSFNCRTGNGSICAGAMISSEGALLKPDRDPREVETACLGAWRQQHAAAGATPAEALFPVRSDGKSGAIDRKGNVVIPLCFDYVGEFHEGLARFERARHWGFLDATGKAVIPPRFTSAWDFHEGLARVTSGDESHGNVCGFVDTAGSMAIKGLECNSAFGAGYEFRDGRARIDVDITKNGFIDKTGNVVIPPEFKSVEAFAEGLAPAAKAGEAQCGYLDISGHWAIQPRFEWALGFSDGLALVQMKGSCGYVDRNGTVILQPADITTDCWPSLGHFSEGLASKLNSGKYGFMDRTGKVIIPEQFDQVKPFAEGMAAVLIGKDWGYIDQSGRIAIPPRRLQKTESFHNGLARMVTADSKEGYLDKSGKYVWPPTRTAKD